MKSIRNFKIEKLSDDLLDNICSGGGLDPKTKIPLMLAGDVIMASGLVGSVVTTIVSTVYEAKGNEAKRNAKNKEDLRAADEYFRTAEKLLIADGVLFGIGVLGTVPYCVGKWA